LIFKVNKKSAYLPGIVKIPNSVSLTSRCFKYLIIRKTDETKTHVYPNAYEYKRPETPSVIDEAKSFLRVEYIIPPSGQGDQSDQCGKNPLQNENDLDSF
jgi:hypothetical protein